MVLVHQVKGYICVLQKLTVSCNFTKMVTHFITLHTFLSSHYQHGLLHMGENFSIYHCVELPFSFFSCIPLLCLFLYSLQHIIPIITTAISAPPIAAMTPVVMAIRICINDHTVKSQGNTIHWLK